MSKPWRAWLSEEASHAITVAAEAAHPNETGGVLIGVLAAGRPWITHAIELSPRISCSRFYQPPPGARQAAVRRLRRRDARLGYLGEWHSHPMDAPPSTTDAETMRRLGETGDCPRPLLLIARRTGQGYRLDARQWMGRSLRVLRLVAAGPLEDVASAEERPRRGRRGIVARVRR